MHYFELPKLPEPEVVTDDDELKLWFTLFNAETEEDLARKEAVSAFREVAASEAFREAIRLREKALQEEEQILSRARLEECEKWQPIIEEKKAIIAELKALLGEN